MRLVVAVVAWRRGRTGPGTPRPAADSGRSGWPGRNRSAARRGSGRREPDSDPGIWTASSTAVSPTTSEPPGPDPAAPIIGPDRGASSTRYRRSSRYGPTTYPIVACSPQYDRTPRNPTLSIAGCGDLSSRSQGSRRGVVSIPLPRPRPRTLPRVPLTRISPPVAGAGSVLAARADSTIGRFSRPANPPCRGDGATPAHGIVGQAKARRQHPARGCDGRVRTPPATGWPAARPAPPAPDRPRRRPDGSSRRLISRSRSRCSALRLGGVVRLVRASPAKCAAVASASMLAERLLLRRQQPRGAGVLGHEHRRGGRAQVGRPGGPAAAAPRPARLGGAAGRASAASPGEPIRSRSTTSPASSRLVANTRISFSRRWSASLSASGSSALR